ncbi:hypothetical protein AWC38_SpisGene22872 [Stylophora pistillata]|uniref:CCHC-type domain-containing protein n=1 Tax=Stylophora pistillata TaxID=50429 RepID=A0A2B4R7D2_STYPI|nr:hypothetical protein AWC38_SpisGene22872 [Stylophora pistillata]
MRARNRRQRRLLGAPHTWMYAKLKDVITNYHCIYERTRALAEEAVRQENLAVSSSSHEWPAPPPPVQQSRVPFFRSLFKSANRSPRVDTKSQPFSGIPTPSECSLVSSCTGSQSSDSEEDLIYESGKTRENLSNRKNVSEDSLEARNDSVVDSRHSSLDSNQLSLAPAYAEMEDQAYASAWFKTLPRADEMSFEELSEKLVTHFASGASEWRVRQALGQQRQLKKESVADYAYSLRTHYTRINLPNSEWTHYFVQGLIPEIREYVVLQQPENLESAENVAKLKESVLQGSSKHADFNPKEVSAKIFEELSKAINPKDKSISAVGPASDQNPHLSKSEMQQIIRDEFREFMGSNINTRPSGYNQRSNQNFQLRSSRSRFGDAVCYNCGRKGHTYYFCRSKPDPRNFRCGSDRQNFYRNRGQNSSDWQYRNLSGGSCNADKLAFSKAKPADSSVDDRVDLAQHVIVKDSCQTSPKHLSSHPPQSGRQKQGACLESSIVIILRIILAIVIKVLELFEVVITSTVEVFKQPPVSSKGHATLVSGASTPKLSALSVQDKTPECLCKGSKEEPRSFKSAVVEENSLVFEQADIFNDDVLSSDDIVISEVISNNAEQNKVPDSDKALCSDYSPLASSDLENSEQGSTSLSVSMTLNNFSSRAEADSFIQPVSNYVEDKVNDISISFAPGSALLPVSIEGHNFQCLIDSGAALTAVSANVWRKHLCHAYPELGVSDSESVTTVNGSRLTTIGKTLMEFVIGSRIFTFEVCVIKDLSFDVILGRDFLQRFCFKVDFKDGVVSFPSEPSPFPFQGVSVDDDNDLIDKAFISSVHASHTFVIPPQSEVLISGARSSIFCI